MRLASSLPRPLVQADGTEMLGATADVYADLGEATQALETGVALYTRKGNVVMAKGRERLSEANPAT